MYHRLSEFTSLPHTNFTNLLITSRYHCHIITHTHTHLHTHTHTLRDRPISSWSSSALTQSTTQSLALQAQNASVTNILPTLVLYTFSPTGLSVHALHGYFVLSGMSSFVVTCLTKLSFRQFLVHIKCGHLSVLRGRLLQNTGTFNIRLGCLSQSRIHKTMQCRYRQWPMTKFSGGLLNATGHWTSQLLLQTSAKFVVSNGS